jgi:hypothetical protein
MRRLTLVMATLTRLPLQPWLGAPMSAPQIAGRASQPLVRFEFRLRIGAAKGSHQARHVNGPAVGLDEPRDNPPIRLSTEIASLCRVHARLLCRLMSDLEPSLGDARGMPVMRGQAAQHETVADRSHRRPRGAHRGRRGARAERVVRG